MGDRVTLEPDAGEPESCYGIAAVAERTRPARAPGARGPRHPAGRRQHRSGLRRHRHAAIRPRSPSSSIGCSSWPRPTRSPPPSSSTRWISIRGRHSSSGCRQAGYEVLPTSVKTGGRHRGAAGAGPGTGRVVTGPSGAGKSSLLNALAAGPRAPDRRDQPPGPARQEHHRLRRHACRSPPAAILVDTPGFSEVGLWGIDPRRAGQLFSGVPPDDRGVSLPGLPSHDASRAARSPRRWRRGRSPPTVWRASGVLLAELESAPEEWE